MRESKNVEYKEKMSNSFLKTVSAYANYGAGVIVFGINDSGTVIGIENPKKLSLDIENRINDSISPVPDYSLNVNKENSTITLYVSEGLHKPYLYKSKAYKRNNTTTVEVDRVELTRLILEGQNLSFEELPAKKQNLTFSYLGDKLKNVLQIEEITKDTLKTLELYNNEQGYNIAGELLADTNSFSGIDMVRFGDNISILLDRETHDRMSILEQYDRALNLYRKYYQFEQIKGAYREKKELIPEDAFREAIANALVHRTWDINAHITVSMLSERIEIVSPGGLPKGMSEEGYSIGGLSILRNRIIGNVFFRLHLIERFGTGIRRINEAYKKSVIKPTFDISTNYVKITLPVMERQNNLSDDEKQIYSLLKGRHLSSSEIVKATGFGKTKVVSILNRLVSSGYIKTSGNGRSLKYFSEFLL